MRKEWTEAKIGGLAGYADLVYLFASLLGEPATAQLDPPAGLAHQWDFAPSSTAEDAVRTLTVEQGSAARAHRFSYGLVTDLALRFSREEVTVDGSMLARRSRTG